MLEEYKQMVSAFFDLSKQKSDMFRFYLIIVTIPITLIAAIFSVEHSLINIYNLPILVVLILYVVAIGGLVMTAIIVDIRFECILYAKTVNLVRRFFADKESELQAYLVLPDGDDLPRFYEQPWELKKRIWKWELGAGSMFLQITLMGLLNSTYLGLGIANMPSLKINYVNIEPFWLGLIGGVLFFLLHIMGYRYFAIKKDKQWKIKKTSAQ